jgi:hypothetical protein
MIFFKKYASIENYLLRYTILKIANFHIRLHTIVDHDKTTLYHNHPFNYISIILKGQYVEHIYNSNTYVKRSFLNFAYRSNKIYHKIESINGPVVTLFITFGKYKWNAINTLNCTESGIHLRKIKGKIKWCKIENGIWYIGHFDKEKTIQEKRHSIYQMENIIDP